MPTTHAPSRAPDLPSGPGEHPFVEPAELRADEVRRHPVVVVGGSITGLTMACALAKLGVPTILLEEDNTVGTRGASSGGICYTQKSLEIFQRLGLYERMAAKGVQWQVSRTFSGLDEVYAFDVRQQSNWGLSCQPPFLNIHQAYVEAGLVEQLAAIGHVDLRWQSRVTAFVQNKDFATLTVQTPAGSYDMQASFVVDATGARTPFHAWCGANLTAAPADDCWCIADVRFKKPLPPERHTWIEAPFNDNLAAWQQPIADNLWRLDYQMAPGTDLDQANWKALVRERLQRQFGARVTCDIVWAGPYTYRSQSLDQLRVGSVFFIGDTATILRPFGARGGNAGIADADNLAWKLAAVLMDRAPPELLDSYHEERHEAAEQNVHATNRTARFLRAAPGAEQLFREATVSLARQYPFGRPLVNTGRMAVANSYTRSSVCESTGGLSVQNVAFRWADGSDGAVNDLLEWADGNLLILVFGQLSAAASERLRQLASHAPVRCVQALDASSPPQALEHVIDPQGHLQGACHVFGHAWAILRPDGYLSATGEAVDAQLVYSIEHALAMK